jgi:hypothetical protein
MSMRHHWHELDELLAQIDREERFKRGPFRPGMKPLGDATASPQKVEDIDGASDNANVVPLNPLKAPAGG